ncbi:MAG: hypothetical protein PUC58_01345 [Oscillospiraceae bacterium]|nr:hypothetical protein [Oscillospiraceae bacterium]
MALELKSKPKSAKAKVSAATPTKKTMNFSHHVSSFDLRKMMPAIIVIVIVIGLFAKFGIIDQLSRKTSAFAELSDIQTQQDVLNARLKDYPELEQQYGRYSYGWMSEDEVSLVDRMEVYKLIESKIMDAAVIENFAVNGNVITMNMRGITLIEASAVVKDLESSDMVDSAYVYSAEAENAEQAQMFMTINISKEAK